MTKNEVYHKNGGYHMLVAKDASVALGKMNLEKQYYDTTKYNWRDLTTDELNVL